MQTACGPTVSLLTIKKKTSFPLAELSCDMTASTYNNSN